jgi:hypothetical protein
MLNNAKPHFNLCVCYIYPMHTCIAQSTATRKIILDANLLPSNFAVLKWFASVKSGLYRRYTSWINTDKPFVSLVHTPQWHHYGPWRVQHVQFLLLCTYLGVCLSRRSKQLRLSVPKLWVETAFGFKKFTDSRRNGTEHIAILICTTGNSRIVNDIWIKIYWNCANLKDDPPRNKKQDLKFPKHN